MQNSACEDPLEKIHDFPAAKLKYNHVFFHNMGLENTLSNILKKNKNIHSLYSQINELSTENSKLIEENTNLSVLNEKLLMENQKLMVANSELEIGNKNAIQEKSELLIKIERLKRINQELLVQIKISQISGRIVEKSAEIQPTIDFELEGVREIVIEQIQEIEETEIVVDVEEKNLKKCPMCGEHSREKTFECPYCKNEGIITFICSRHFQSHMNKCHPPASGKTMKIEGGRGVYSK